jgi:4-hydroxy-3-methylbut-2-en-1-yl diphosphate synthase IspG/GcpE
VQYNISGEMSMSQCQTVLNHLEYASITSMQAFSEYGITRLAARIADLRESGCNVVTTMVSRNGKTFAVYSIKEKAQQEFAGL